MCIRDRKQTSPLQGEFLEKNRKQLQNLFLMTAALIFIFVATFRYGIGYDYFNYENLYEQLGPLSIQQLVTDHVGREFIGYSIFTHLCWELGLSYRMLLFVVNIILTAIVFWFLKRYSPLPWLGAYLYLTLQFFAHSMNPVSYTHLDVYKRQEKQRLFCTTQRDPYL